VAILMPTKKPRGAELTLEQHLAKYHSINYCRILLCFLLERCRVDLLEEGDFFGRQRWHLSLQRHGMR
jgi:hypothetical protein